MPYKKIKKLLPGDLVSFPAKIGDENPVVLILSATECRDCDTAQEAFFLIIGDELIYDGVSCAEAYYLISRVKN